MTTNETNETTNEHVPTVPHLGAYASPATVMNAVADYIEEEGRFNQHVWGQLLDSDIEDQIHKLGDLELAPACKTAGCQAGTAALATGWRFKVRQTGTSLTGKPIYNIVGDEVTNLETGETADASEVGQKVMGLSNEDANVLFRGNFENLTDMVGTTIPEVLRHMARGGSLAEALNMSVGEAEERLDRDDYEDGHPPVEAEVRVTVTSTYTLRMQVDSDGDLTNGEIVDAAHDTDDEIVLLRAFDAEGEETDRHDGVTVDSSWSSQQVQQTIDARF